MGLIGSETGLSKGHIGKYLSVLRELDIVRREIPITKSKNTKQGIYRISDNYFNFWFRYIYPSRDLIETENYDLVLEYIKKKDLKEYLGFIFESVAQEFLLKLNREKKLPILFTKIGRWWYRGQEIDIIMLDKINKKALAVEVKWKTLSLNNIKKIVRQLTQKMEHTSLTKNYECEFGIVAKKIINKENVRHSLNIHCWDLSDFQRLM